MQKDKTYLGFPILLLGSALLALVVGTSSARAATISPENSASVGADVGAALSGTKSASPAKSVWSILGIGTNGLSLNVSPKTTSTFGPDGAGTASKNFTSGKGPPQSVSSGLKGIDLCESSSNCSASSSQNGLHASTILAAASLSGPKATLKSLMPITFQTPGHTHVIGDVGVVPLPGTLPLLAAAIGALAILGRARRAK